MSDILHTERRTIEGVTYKFTVRPDYTAEDPREWDDNVQILTYRAPRLSHAADSASDANTGTMQAFMVVFEDTGDEELALKVAQRYARIFEPGTTIETHSLIGYSQGDWRDVVTVSDNADNIPGVINVFNSWLWGDIYDVSVDIVTVCEHCDTETLEPHYALSGICSDSYEEAVSHFVDNYLELVSTE